MSSTEQKWKISAFSALLFIIVAAPYSELLVRKSLRAVHIPVYQYSPLIVQTLIFLLLVRYSMELKLFRE